MGKSKIKPYVVISGFALTDNNRGTAALGYGSIPFMEECGWLYEGQTLLNYRFIKNPFKKKNRGVKACTIKIGEKEWLHKTINVNFIEKWIYDKFHFILPFTSFGKTYKKIALVAAINGGDGFSDIYGTKIFQSRLPETLFALAQNIPYILLPQTIGPFEQPKNKEQAHTILKRAQKVYIRDRKYVEVLNSLNVDYIEAKDLSYFMKPEPWEVEIEPEAVGLNISGLAYFNSFSGLSNQFENYPELINSIIQYFQEKEKTIYLISHSYNYYYQESNNDDMAANKAVYKKLKNKKGVVLVDKNLNSPQTKYLISKMSYFIGTRMHANFAAIYTGVPLFGLAYSYKFQGAFEANGLKDSTAMINNISKEDIPNIIALIDKKYTSLHKK